VAPETAHRKIKPLKAQFSDCWTREGGILKLAAWSDKLKTRLNECADAYSDMSLAPGRGGEVGQHNSYRNTAHKLRRRIETNNTTRSLLSKKASDIPPYIESLFEDIDPSYVREESQPSYRTLSRKYDKMQNRGEPEDIQAVSAYLTVLKVKEQMEKLKQ